jgi:hypothetical protein
MALGQMEKIPKMPLKNGAERARILDNKLMKRASFEALE